MKHLLQKSLFLLTIIFIFGLFGCEKDLYEDQITNKKEFKMRRITLEELQNIPNAFKKFQSIDDLQRNKAKSKLIYDSINDFTIDTDKIVIYEKDGQYSITFPISRSYESDKVENLVLQSAENNTYIPFIFKYDLTEDEKADVINGNSIIGIENKMTSKYLPELDVDEFGNSSERTTICILVTVAICTEGNHEGGQTNNGSPCPAHGTEQMVFCWDYVGPGGDTGDDGWTGNEGNNTEGNNNNPTNPYTPSGGGNSGGGPKPNTPETPIPPVIVTMPLLELEEEPTEEPCIKMNLLKNDVGFKQKLQDLKTAADNNYFETTIIIADNNNNTPTDNYNYVSSNGNPNIPQAPYLFYPGISKGLLHNHYSGLLSIFTVADLAGIYDIVKNPNVTADELTFALVTKAGTVYALTINDKNQFIAFGNKNLSNEYQKQYLISDLIKNYNVIETNSNDTNEKGFQKMMKDYNMGINLFRGDNVNFNSWTKIQRVKGRFEEINCN